MRLFKWINAIYEVEYAVFMAYTIEISDVLMSFIGV
jgi:hypothetical protein